MTGQERDDAESTEGLAGEAEPAPEVSADEPPPDQLGTARLEPERPDAAQPEPVVPPTVGPGGTSVMPPVPGGPPPAPEQPRWAARAQVPTPRGVEEYGDEWVTEPPRRLLIPVLLTACVMLLLGVVGAGVWLALSDNGPPGPSPTTATGTSTPTAPVTTSSSTPPTTTTSTTPAGLQVPDVSGQEYEVAAQTLAGLGLEPERVDRFSDTVPAGQVIATDPTVASAVAPGETIRVFVSLGPEPTDTPTETATATPTETEDEGD